MTEDQNAALGRAIFDNIGGPENVEKLIHCMTRVRLTIRDDSKIDFDKLRAIPGVLGVVEDETLQVVVGPGKVNKVAQSMVDMVGVKLGEEFPQTKGTTSLVDETAQNKAAAKAKYNRPSRFKNVLKSISNIFVPMIPAFVGAGMIAGIASILQNMMTAGQLDAGQWTQIIAVLNIIKNGIFSYLAIYTGINAATEFGATPAVGGVVGAVTLLTGMDPELPLKNLFDGQALLSGQGGIIGVIFAVWLLSLLEKRLHRWIPDALDIIVVPTISLLIIGLMTIFVIMPIAGVISTQLVGAINFVLHVGGGFSGFVLGSLFLPMVMFGLHQILTPIHLEMIEKTGSTQLLPILAMAGAGQVGAALALWVKLRHNHSVVEKVKGALPVGILGIGEPLIYGVTLPMGRPFITACLGGGIGGAIIGALGHVGAIAIGPSGIALIPLIANGKWLIYVFGLLGGYAGGFVLTYFFGIPKEELALAQAAKTAQQEKIEQSTPASPVIDSDQNFIFAPFNGEALPLSALSDDVFATGMMGQGVAFEPADGQLMSPVTGVVETIFPTRHAIGLKADSGAEILLHVGMDTVKLNGAGFTPHVIEGQRVQVGTLLMTVDLDAIKAAGYPTTTPMIILNTSDYQVVNVIKNGQIITGEAVLELVK
ncbi:PTS glucose transporter subunit IIA [Weissella diestrammenae]|uniref:PTS glucose transporter subunit IIA n=1 Tax=Weissella diestrammenae TaxID=1162633 RepID=A0A7G9T3K8_9LACO|nr:glucose PTS transporter subunit IIA [Weissella diestrammenae]MCM0582657.1 PTS glucose transporter subunit IIA [Weissella diestrammenae]QNN74683.1 PTS glucose transporter subunit IIA [Weissella diestrammenae]